jgi:hypothetical protein
MKKIIIIALAVVTTGLASCSKDNSVKPASAKATKVIVADKQDLGVAE